MHRVMTYKEVEDSNACIDDWWGTLSYQLKGALRDMVWTLQHPIDPNLPMTYAEDMEPAKLVTKQEMQDAVAEMASVQPTQRQGRR